MLLQETGGSLDEPPRIYLGYGLNSLRRSPPLKLQTANDSVFIIKDCNRQYSCNNFILDVTIDKFY